MGDSVSARPGRAGQRSVQPSHSNNSSSRRRHVRREEEAAERAVADHVVRQLQRGAADAHEREVARLRGAALRVEADDEEARALRQPRLLLYFHGGVGSSRFQSIHRGIARAGVHDI